jgi:hypothetical protein
VRLKNVTINPESSLLELDIMQLPETFVVVVSEGRARLTELPTHGETKIVTHQGKVKRVKFDEGEEF